MEDRGPRPTSHTHIAPLYVAPYVEDAEASLELSGENATDSTLPE
jgi:hypothetical protein